jgi:flagellar motor switch protein FliM
VSGVTLSQNDIDRLLVGSAAPRPSTTVRLGEDVQLYDFRRPFRVSKERMRTLEAMYERMVRSLEGWLIGRVRGQVELRLQSIEQFSFGEFTLSLPTPCAAYIFDIHDTGGQQGVVDVGHEFAYFLVDRLFGGSGVLTTMDRALSPIERMAVRTVVDRITQLLAEIWRDHVPLDLQNSGFESFPDILQVANREDPVLVANIEATAGSMRSLILVLLPFAVLEKFFNSGGQRGRLSDAVVSDREREANRELTEISLRSTQVDVAVRLPSFKLPMKSLMDLPVGAVLSTGIARDAECEVFIGGQRRFTAMAGRVKQKLSAQVLESITDGPAPRAPGRSNNESR